MRLLKFIIKKERERDKNCFYPFPALQSHWISYVKDWSNRNWQTLLRESMCVFIYMHIYMDV